MTLLSSLTRSACIQDDFIKLATPPYLCIGYFCLLMFVQGNGTCGKMILRHRLKNIPSFRPHPYLHQLPSCTTPKFSNRNLSLAITRMKNKWSYLFLIMIDQ